MTSKQHEIEAIVEDLSQIDAFAGSQYCLPDSDEASRFDYHQVFINEYL
jgi:hypothetical protein